MEGENTGSPTSIATTALLEVLPGHQLVGEPPLHIPRIQIHAAAVQPGDLFVALRGARVDSHQFVAEAVARGAALVLVERLQATEVPSIVVSDTQQALAHVAAAFYDYPAEQLTLIGITGTNGKTSTVQFIRQLFGAAGLRTGAMGTLGLQYEDQHFPLANTTPGALPLQAALARLRAAECTHVAMEVSSHALAMGRTRGCRFRLAILTNISRDHLDYHRTMEQYVAAKQLLFSQLGSAYPRQEYPIALLHADVAELEAFRAVTAAPVLTYAVERPADLRAEEVVTTSSGTTRFVLHSWAGKMAMEAPFVGRFHVENLLAALGAALLMGIPLAALPPFVAGLQGITGRLERVDHGQVPFRVWLDYAHTPDGLQHVLAALRPQVEGRLFCLIGCGGDRDQGKRAPMAAVAVAGSDEVVLTTDNPRFEDPEAILQAMEAGIGPLPDGPPRYRKIVDRGQAIAWALSQAQAGDGVLIAGKGHEEYQEVRDERIPFSDRRVVQGLLAQQRGRLQDAEK